MPLFFSTKRKRKRKQIFTWCLLRNSIWEIMWSETLGSFTSSKCRNAPSKYLKYYLTDTRKEWDSLENMKMWQWKLHLSLINFNDKQTSLWTLNSTINNQINSSLEGTGAIVLPLYFYHASNRKLTWIWFLTKLLVNQCYYSYDF